MTESPRLFLAVWSCQACEVSWVSARCAPCWVCGQPGRNGVPMDLFMTNNAARSYAADRTEGGMVS